MPSFKLNMATGIDSTDEQERMSTKTSLQVIAKVQLQCTPERAFVLAFFRTIC